MDIKTKAKPGDLVYYFHNYGQNTPKLCSSKVMSVRVFVNDTDFRIEYNTSHGVYLEEFISLSKEELSKTILDGSYGGVE